jgi:S-DNA-T family DNA segregation ATPase FtsK/SpoIIIE
MASSSFSVTKVRLAFECPRLFYLVHQEGGFSMFYHPESSKGVGKIFHRLCQDSIVSMLNHREFTDIFTLSDNLTLEKVSQQIRALLYKLVFFPLLRRLKEKKSQKIDLIYQLWQSFEKLIYQWSIILISNSNYLESSDLFRKTFITEEYQLKHEFNLKNNTQQLVKGRLDSLIFDAQRQRLIVIDYKTYQPIDPTANLVQVALYSYMLSVSRGIKVDAAVYVLLPQFKEYYYKWEQLESKIYQLIPPKLLQMKQWLQWQVKNNHDLLSSDKIFEHNSPSHLQTEDLSLPPSSFQPHLCQICPQHLKCKQFFG